MARRPTTLLQRSFRFRSWGGKRKGAGRPRRRGSRLSHVTRPRLTARNAAHVTLKLRRDIGNLRTKKRANVIRQAIVKAIDGGFRIIDWSIQGDHLHMISEVANAAALSRSMQGLCIRIARGLNRELGRRGKVFADRYHVRVLETPREVRNARAYVMLNARRHAAQRGRELPANWVDPYSSWAWFDGWKNCPRRQVRQARAGPEAECCASKPHAWLTRLGWRRHGLVRIDEVPGRRS